MAEQTGLKAKATGLIDNIKYYWKKPPKGKYMSFKEVASYAFGGIGAYLIVCMSIPCILGATNVFLSGTIGIGMTDMYIMYVIGVLSGIPLTGLRANIIDNTRNKAGKYRPYLLRMGIPCSIIFVLMVWFPYDKLGLLVGSGMILGKSATYVAKCAVVMAFNIALQFFYYFFYDAYENLIHVLSPNSQERADVASVKSIIYSFGPTVYNIIIPLIAGIIGVNQTDIRVYRIAFPVIGVIGTLLVFVVYANTQEKIIQAKTHVIQIKFTDALREVAKNKYFWIIACAGWLGFLESAYGAILQWSFTYGHTCNGATYALISTLTGNASLWGMLLAPICIRKWGKKKVLIGVNMFNVLFIAAMLMGMRNIWWLFACVYLNWLVGAFEQITTPAIQADIRDYQQYRSGERIDGMFAAVTTIGNIVTLLTSSVVPFIQKAYGVHDNNGYAKPFDILDVETGQPGLLYDMMKVMIIMAAVGAFMNVVPYFFYDLDERHQKAIVRILKIRALFEDYANGVLDDGNLVEAVDIIREAKALVNEKPQKATRDYKSIKDKVQKKAAKKAYKAVLERNEEIEISKLVCAELDKFETPFYKMQLEANRAVLDGGLSALLEQDLGSVKKELRQAKAMPKSTHEEREYRKFAIEIAKKRIDSCRAIKEYYSNGEVLEAPDFTTLDELFEREDACEMKLRELNEMLTEAKKNNDSDEVKRIKGEIKAVLAEKKVILKKEKIEMDMHARYGRAAKPYIYAEKLVSQQENYTHLEEIESIYDEAKARHEAKLANDKAELERLKAEEDALTAKLRAEKKAKKEAKKEAKK